MKSKYMGIVILVAVVISLLAAAGPALAGGTTDDVIDDAKNGTVDKNWSAAQIRAALAYLRNNPISTQYSDYEGVLEDYLQSLDAPGAVGAGGVGSSGQLAFTGAEIWLILIAGAGLVGGGLALRRRARA